MAVQTILVCEAQVPFVTGGAESLVRSLVDQLRARGYETDLVSLPYKWYPKEEILAHAAAWRLLDLSESNGRPVDLVIGTKFPTYFARHSNKVLWLIHQHRAAYELCGTEYSDFEHTELDVGLRARLLDLDREMIMECRRRFTISETTTRRLEMYNGVHADPLYHPPRLARRLRAGEYGSYVLSVGRLESIKRVDLLIQAMTAVDPAIRLIVAGEGTQRARFEQIAEEHDLAGRVEFLGAIDDDTLIELYAGALAVGFVPYDEDYGLVTLEGFLARKPVVTATDSGGPLEFVEDGVTGLVVEPEPEAIADAIRRLAADTGLARRLGEAGDARARNITWDTVIEKLVETAS
jgi:glycosyltransferase involved in cell wall biosynthesis